VLGEPRGANGEAGEAAERIRRFGSRLARAARLPVEHVDETLSTVEAGERRGVDPTRPGKVPIDAVAAQVILQQALDQAQGESR